MIKFIFSFWSIFSLAGCLSVSYSVNDPKPAHYTLLHFWAPWCMVCKPAIAALNSISPTLATNNVELKHISIKDNNELAQKYKIEELPVTILLDPDDIAIPIIDPMDQTRKERIEGVRGWDSQTAIDAILKSIK